MSGSTTSPFSMHDPKIAALVQHYLANNPENAEDAFLAARGDRRVADRSRGLVQRTPEDLNLRDAEHALFANALMDPNNPRSAGHVSPLYGALNLLAMVPIYSATKALTQYLPQSADRFIPGPASSPPDWNEIKWGLAPLWGGIPPGYSSNPKYGP